MPQNLLYVDIPSLFSVASVEVRVRNSSQSKSWVRSIYYYYFISKCRRREISSQLLNSGIKGQSACDCEPLTKVVITCLISYVRGKKKKEKKDNEVSWSSWRRKKTIVLKCHKFIFDKKKARQKLIKCSICGNCTGQNVFWFHFWESKSVGVTDLHSFPGPFQMVRC